MTTNHAAVAALPVNGGANKMLLRNAITARMPYVLADTENAQDLVAVDPDTGAAIVDMIFLGRLFHYDPTDATTPHDGVTCLVSADGRRYKLSDGADVFCYAVIDRTHTAPPAAPSLGDAYLVATAATGAWAGKDGAVAVKTARGWEFIIFGIGRFIYVEAEDSYYHRNAGGAWVAGFGSQVAQQKSIPLSAAINFGKRLIIENQTTNAPPASPAIGDAYIIGPAPTGDWAGQSSKIAICEVGSTFTIYAPSNGWAAYNKATNASLTFTGSDWKASAGAWAGYQRAPFVTSGSTTFPVGSNAYVFDSANAPTTSVRRAVDNNTLTYTAKRVGSDLRISYSADVQYASLAAGVGSGDAVIMLFRDSEVAAIDWQVIPEVAQLVTAGSQTLWIHLNRVFVITANDLTQHTYTIALSSRVSGSNATNVNVIWRRTLTLEESS